MLESDRVLSCRYLVNRQEISASIYKLSYRKLYYEMICDFSRYTFELGPTMGRVADCLVTANETAVVSPLRGVTGPRTRSILAT